MPRKNGASPRYRRWTTSRRAPRLRIHQKTSKKITASPPRTMSRRASGVSMGKSRLSFHRSSDGKQCLDAADQSTRGSPTPTSRSSRRMDLLPFYQALPGTRSFGIARRSVPNPERPRAGNPRFLPTAVHAGKEGRGDVSLEISVSTELQGSMDGGSLRFRGERGCTYIQLAANNWTNAKVAQQRFTGRFLVVAEAESQSIPGSTDIVGCFRDPAGTLEPSFRVRGASDAFACERCSLSAATLFPYRYTPLA